MSLKKKLFNNRIFNKALDSIKVENSKSTVKHIKKHSEISLLKETKHSSEPPSSPLGNEDISNTLLKAEFSEKKFESVFPENEFLAESNIRLSLNVESTEHESRISSKFVPSKGNIILNHDEIPVPEIEFMQISSLNSSKNEVLYNKNVPVSTTFKVSDNKIGYISSNKEFFIDNLSTIGQSHISYGSSETFSTENTHVNYPYYHSYGNYKPESTLFTSNFGTPSNFILPPKSYITSSTTDIPPPVQPNIPPPIPAKVPENQESHLITNENFLSDQSKLFDSGYFSPEISKYSRPEHCHNSFQKVRDDLNSLDESEIQTEPISWILAKSENSCYSNHVKNSFLTSSPFVTSYKTSTDLKILNNISNSSYILNKTTDTHTVRNYRYLASTPISRSKMNQNYSVQQLMSFSEGIGFIDSHCHLDFLYSREEHSGTFREYQEKVQEYFPVSFEGCVTVFCQPNTFHEVTYWRKIIEEEGVWAAFGCHPHHAGLYNDVIESDLLVTLKHEKVKALGEIGLDYSHRNNCDHDVQQMVFKRQLKIALELNKPLVIHCREAHEDGLRIMKELVPKDYLIHLHCFTDTWTIAKSWLEAFQNLCIGLTNLVTYPSAEDTHNVARNIPLNRLLLETDTPFFVPKTLPKELRFSHPGMAIHVAGQVASLKNVRLYEVLIKTRENTKKIYNI